MSLRVALCLLFPSVSCSCLQLPCAPAAYKCLSELPCVSCFPVSPVVACSFPVSPAVICSCPVSPAVAHCFLQLPVCLSEFPSVSCCSPVSPALACTVSCNCSSVSYSCQCVSCSCPVSLAVSQSYPLSPAVAPCLSKLPTVSCSCLGSPACNRPVSPSVSAAVALCLLQLPSVSCSCPVSIL